jgi:ComF family protein
MKFISHHTGSRIKCGMTCYYDALKQAIITTVSTKIYWRAILSFMLKKCVEFLLPQFCLHCKDKTNNEIPLCQPCQDRLPWYTRKNPLNTTRIAPQDYHQATTTFVYKNPINQWISALKFHQQLHYAKLLADLFIQKIDPTKQPPELILPIPLHRSRLRQRGFSQTIEIARRIGQRTKIPIDRVSLRRIIATKPQSGLSFEDREKNITNAFQCHKAINAKHIALFDDVITTGNTINAALQALKNQGIEKIDIWCCARSALEIKNSTGADERLL